MLIAKLGLDGHDVGAKVVCRALMDAGMDVTYSGLRQSPQEIAEAVVREQPDVLGLSVLSGAHELLCRKVAAELAARGVAGVVWIVGGNVPARDRDLLRSIGVSEVFATGTPFQDIVEFIQERVASPARRGV